MGEGEERKAKKQKAQENKRKALVQLWGISMYITQLMKQTGVLSAACVRVGRHSSSTCSLSIPFFYLFSLYIINIRNLFAAYWLHPFCSSCTLDFLSLFFFLPMCYPSHIPIFLFPFCPTHTHQKIKKSINVPWLVFNVLGLTPISPSTSHCKSFS